MSIASSLIALIDASLLRPHLCGEKEVYQRIRLRNLKSILLCVRNLGDDDDRLTSASLFTGIQSAVTDPNDTAEYYMRVWQSDDLAAELMDLVQMISLNSRSVSLTPDDILGIADCFLNNIADFLAHLFQGLSSTIQISASFVTNLGAAQALILSLKNLLLFAMRCATPPLELQNCCLQIQPLAISAAALFRKPDNILWDDVVIDSNLATLHDMATSPKLYQAYTCLLRSSKLRIPPGMDYDHVLDSLVSLLWDVLRLHACHHSASVKDQLKVLYERLRFLRSALKQQPDGKVRDQFGVLVCDAGIFIFSLFQEHVQVHLDLVLNLVQRFDDIFQANGLKCGDSTNIIEDMKSVKISDGEGEEMQPPEGGFRVVGFKEEEDFVGLLREGISKHLRMVAICGMAGIGKTTLALKVFDNASVKYHFQAFAWCTISQVLDKKKVFIELLNQIQPSPNYQKEPEDNLANMLRQSLKGKKYLILLDDVWTNEAWQSLKGSFPDDSKHSRIILTSRHHGVAPPGLLVNGESHSLRLREDRECLEILKSKLFPETGWPLDLAEFGMKIAAKCKGLPLTATIVAGLLATNKQEDWNGVLDDLSSGVISGAEQCNISLELSYNHLPGELQPCFLYFGMYPEDHMVPVRELIRLWMAEGLVENDSLERREDVATGYLNGLIKRNLVMIAVKKSIGGVKTCRVHDVLHDFCVKRAKQESFFHILFQRYDQLSNFIEPCSLQRLCIHSELNHFVKSRLFCPRALSLLFFPTQEKEATALFDMSFIVKIFKLVKVLDIGKIVLATEIPSELQFLTHLKYLSISSVFGGIPSWIGNLSNLETFIVHTWEKTSLPDTFWNLQKLKYLYISGHRDICLPSENIDNSLVLSELETLVGVVFDASLMEKQMRKFPNIRRLKCEIKSTEKDIKIVIPDLLTQLESLSIRGFEFGNLICEFGNSAQSLRKVSLEYFELSRDVVAMMGNFPKLEILKLEYITFPEGTLEMEEGDFLKLRVLILSDFRHFGGSFKRWTASDELPNLQKLVLRYCRILEELPSWLETISTLEKIQVYGCSDIVEGLVRDIEQVLSDYGNSVEVRIHSH